MAASGEVRSVADEAAFSEVLTKHNRQLVVVHFWAEWAPQCTQMNNVMVELAKNPVNVNVVFLKIEAESVPAVSQKYNMAAVPTIILLQNGKEVDRVNGANAPELTQKVKQHAGGSAGVTVDTSAPVQDLNTRLSELVKRSPVMLFMKGNPAEPRCGFSKKIVALLNEQGVKFDSFDILTDEEVRQGLKKFSNWPTYPQLYGSGELVGGLDIVKELAETGELMEQLPKQS